MYESLKKELFSSGNLSELNDEQLKMFIRKVYIRQHRDESFNDEDLESAEKYIFQSIRGLGVIDDYLRDDSVSEIMINGPDAVFIEKSGVLLKTDCKFNDEKELLNIIQRIVGTAGREVNQASPIVDTRLPGGERVNVVLPPISFSGPVVTIRRFPKKRITMEDLVSNETISRQAADFLRLLVESKHNIFISGGTSSGKTTFLNALSDYISKDERIITIEDSAELQITGINNLVRLETRNANTAGVGEITMKELIRTSLRMRPERIIVGEVRGAEAIDMLGAMNTGHDGSLSTGHANSCVDMLSRLENMVLQGNSNLPLLAIRQNIASSIDVIVHLGKLSGGQRKVLEITELVRVKKYDYELNCLFKQENGLLLPTGNKLINRIKLETYGEKNAKRVLREEIWQRI